ncbi:MAG TPA: twin-arginine translocase subunit TatC [Longimicrobiales bacterium]|nr:twin-arginine translocase subunit TatC [Longimicrobiales bacterium]
MGLFGNRIPRAAGASGEMPFFDHLEELRWRILWSLLALVVGTIIGFIVSIRYDLLSVLKRPLDPYLDGEALVSLTMTGPFMMTFKLALTIGIILAVPVVVYQIWAFLAPALSKRERRTIMPALGLGAVLFAIGVATAYMYVLPMTLKFLEGFQTPSMQLMPTADKYFSFVISLLVAFGVVFELPVVVMILATLGLVTSKFLASKRRHAIAAMTVLAALITPGDAVTAMVFMMGPLILLYELGILLTKLVERGRRRAAALDTLAEETP